MDWSITISIDDSHHGSLTYGSIVSIVLLKYFGNLPTRFSRFEGKCWWLCSFVLCVKVIHVVTGLLADSVYIRITVFNIFCYRRSLGDGSSVSSDIAAVDVVR